MKTSKFTPKNLFSFVPSSGPGLVGLIVMVIVVFSLGVWLSGGSDTEVATDQHEHDQSASSTTAPEVWTCSMHPQIKLPKEGKCPICLMDLILLETSSDDLGPRQLKLSESAKQLARIQTTPAIRSFAETEVRMVGRIAYDETKLSYITAWIPGRLDRLFADYTGMTVKKGDHLVSIYSPELLATQEELIQANATVNKLSKGSGGLLASTAKATVDAAREKLRLYGLTTEQIEQVETSQNASDHLTINAPIGGVVVHKSAQEGMYVKTGTQIYTIADLTQLWVMFEAYESDLSWLKYGQSVSFRSPSFPGESFDALISFIHPVVDPKTRTVQIRAIVDNKDMRLKPDMFVRGVVKSRIDGKGKVIDEFLAGKWICPMHPEVVKNQPGQCDICGMDLVRAESLGYAGKQLTDEDASLLIPITAPMITGKRAIVYVELPSDEGALFEGREIELGPRAGDFYVVMSGIEEGELVVVNGAFKIDAELQIQAKPSMMSPDGSSGSVGGMHAGHQMPATENKSKAVVSKSKKATKAITPLYAPYFDLQMALAGDDVETARASASKLSEKIKAVDMSAFSRSEHTQWMDLAKTLSASVTEIDNSSDIAAVRASFYKISNTMIELHDNFGHEEDRDYFLTFCPMANDNKGAFWLQTVDTVYNSFYGDMMLRCGEIKKPLPSHTAQVNQ